MSETLNMEKKSSHFYFLNSNFFSSYVLVQGLRQENTKVLDRNVAYKKIQK